MDEDIVIGMPNVPQLTDTARLLAHGMRDNPLHLRAFGDNTIRVEAALAPAFDRLLRRQRRVGVVLGAWAGEQLVGVAAMVPPGHCQPPLAEKLAMLPTLVRTGAITCLPRIRRWLTIWSRHDPACPHWHLGPVAVDPDWQGRSIGDTLLSRLCTTLDARNMTGYLETDKSANVRLYQRHGFKAIDEQLVLGTTNWFMLREVE